MDPSSWASLRRTTRRTRPSPWRASPPRPTHLIREARCLRRRTVPRPIGRTTTRATTAWSSRPRSGSRTSGCSGRPFPGWTGRSTTTGPPPLTTRRRPTSRVSNINGGVGSGPGHRRRHRGPEVLRREDQHVLQREVAVLGQRALPAPRGLRAGGRALGSPGISHRELPDPRCGWRRRVPRHRHSARRHALRRPLEPRPAPGQDHHPRRAMSNLLLTLDLFNVFNNDLVLVRTRQINSDNFGRSGRSSTRASSGSASGWASRRKTSSWGVPRSTSQLLHSDRRATAGEPGAPYSQRRAVIGSTARTGGRRIDRTDAKSNPTRGRPRLVASEDRSRRGET